MSIDLFTINILGKILCSPIQQDLFILIETQTGEGDAIWEGMGHGVTPGNQNISHHVTEPPAFVSLIHLKSHLFKKKKKNLAD